MANPTVGTNGTHQTKEVYIDQIVPLMRQEFVVRSTFSRDYERDPKTGQLQVPVRDMDVKVSDYDILNGTELAQSATTYLPILIDKHKAINELIDGYEAAVVPDNIKAQRIESAGYSTGYALEMNSINALVEQGTVDEDTTAITAENVYKTILNRIKVVKKKGVLKSRMYVVISDDTEELLLTDEKFSNSSSQLGAELLREGVIGKINGVKVKTSSLLPENVEFIVYAIDWCQAIDEWSIPATINDLADGKHIGASALQGRMEYTDKVTNKNAVLVKKKSSVTDPEITGLTIIPTASLQEGNPNVNADAVVATLSAEGGTSPFTYALEADETNGVDNASFKIDGTNVKVNTTPLTQKDYKINVKVTDTKGKTFTNHATISVAAAAE